MSQNSENRADAAGDNAQTVELLRDYESGQTESQKFQFCVTVPLAKCTGVVITELHVHALAELVQFAADQDGVRVFVRQPLTGARNTTWHLVTYHHDHESQNTKYSDYYVSASEFERKLQPFGVAIVSVKQPYSWDRERYGVVLCRDIAVLKRVIGACENYLASRSNGNTRTNTVRSSGVWPGSGYAAGG